MSELSFRADPLLNALYNRCKSKNLRFLDKWGIMYFQVEQMVNTNRPVGTLHEADEALKVHSIRP